MICNCISVNNFRNIKECLVEFDPGVNILLGNNAQGKTNLIEAVYFAALGKSFRGAHEADFISFDQKNSAVSLDYTDSLRRQNITMEFYRDKVRRVSQNGVKLSRMSEMIGKFRAVLFCPEHLSIIKEGPALRRQYLDVAISQLRPLYMKSLQRYNHILLQRNKLIKSASESIGNAEGRTLFNETVDVWSRQLAHEAAFITVSRAKYLALAADEVKKCFCEMTDGSELPTLEYCSSVKIKAEDITDRKSCEEYYNCQLESFHEREIAAGATLWGIHKDDIEIKINGRSARQFASQGQQRSLSLALKLAEGEISRRDSGEEPVFLLDDVFSELDGCRRAYLTEKMKNKQIILSTCTEAIGENGEKELQSAGSAGIIRVKDGSFYKS